MINDPILILENVSKHFGDISVLQGICASIPEGSVTAFIGPNGAGKTTLFHTITGDLKPDKGTVLFRGRAIGGLAPWRVARYGLGKLFQDVRVFESLTVLENVLLALNDHPARSVASAFLHAPFRKGIDERFSTEAQDWLERAGVERPYDRPAGLLSFGNKKLLALARLMAGRFDLLLLDEPSSGISPQAVRHVAELIRAMVREQKTTIMLIEHNFSFVSEIADHAYVLEHGAIHDHGLTAEVLGKEDNRQTLIGL